MNDLSLRKLFVKTLALFTVVRGYNIAMLVLAQYLASLFVFNPDKNHIQILWDKNLNFIILASALSAAAGYIINNFYDLEKDAINRPLQNYIERFISQNFKLNIYLALNILALGIGYFVSWRVSLFFAVYQFLVWFYSHKINKIVWLNNIYAVSLKIIPFFALFLYYGNLNSIVFFHAGYLLLLLLVTDILKDLTSSTADTIYNYSTLPVMYGDKTTKKILTLFMCTTAIWSVFMWTSSETGYMKYYFLFSGILNLILILPLWNSHSKTTYKILHLIFKLLIAFGIFNLVFIDINPLDLQKII